MVDLTDHLGAQARREIRSAPQQWGGEGRATAGMVLGIVGTVLLVLGLLAIALFVIVAVSSSSSIDGTVSPSGERRMNSNDPTRADSASVSRMPYSVTGAPTREKVSLFDAVDAVEPDLVVCAGYMRLIGAAAVEARAGRIVNIHPSLLPAFKGLHTHQQALDARAAEHGASVHFVTADLDGGPVIAQARVQVHPGDDAGLLAERVLEREHPLLVETLRWFAAGRIALAEGVVHVDGAARAPLQLGANQRFA